MHIYIDIIFFEVESKEVLAKCDSICDMSCLKLNIGKSLVFPRVSLFDTKENPLNITFWTQKNVFLLYFFLLRASSYEKAAGLCLYSFRTIVADVLNPLPESKGVSAKGKFNLKGQFLR